MILITSLDLHDYNVIVNLLCIPHQSFYRDRQFYLNPGSSSFAIHMLLKKVHPNVAIVMSNH